MMNDVPFLQFFTHFKLDSYLPAPDRFYKSAGSMIAAAAFGAAYGLIGRVVYPKAGISPLHYALWFTVAFQIKYCINFIESNFEEFMGVGAFFNELENVPEDELDVQDQIRYHCWKIIHLRNTVLKKIDEVFSFIFYIRPYEEVTTDNVDDASFMEMCRYRIWGVFKSTLLDTLSSALAYRLTNGMGFALPDRTSVPLFLIIRSIVLEILLIPSLHLYARFCNQLADDLGESDHTASQLRAKWLKEFLPAL